MNKNNRSVCQMFALALAASILFVPAAAVAEKDKSSKASWLTRTVQKAHHPPRVTGTKVTKESTTVHSRGSLGHRKAAIQRRGPHFELNPIIKEEKASGIRRDQFAEHRKLGGAEGPMAASDVFTIGGRNYDRLNPGGRPDPDYGSNGLPGPDFGADGRPIARGNRGINRGNRSMNAGTIPGQPSSPSAAPSGVNFGGGGETSIDIVGYVRDNQGSIILGTGLALVGNTIGGGPGAIIFGAAGAAVGGTNDAMRRESRDRARRQRERSNRIRERARREIAKDLARYGSKSNGNTEGKGKTEGENDDKIEREGKDKDGLGPKSQPGVDGSGGGSWRSGHIKTQSKRDKPRRQHSRGPNPVLVSIVRGDHVNPDPSRSKAVGRIANHVSQRALGSSPVGDEGWFGSGSPPRPRR